MPCKAHEEDWKSNFQSNRKPHAICLCLLMFSLLWFLSSKPGFDRNRSKTMCVHSYKIFLTKNYKLQQHALVSVPVATSQKRKGVTGTFRIVTRNRSSSGRCLRIRSSLTTTCTWGNFFEISLEFSCVTCLQYLIFSTRSVGGKCFSSVSHSNHEQCFNFSSFSCVAAARYVASHSLESMLCPPEVNVSDCIAVVSWSHWGLAGEGIPSVKCAPYACKGISRRVS